LIQVAISCCEDTAEKRPELQSVISTLKATYLRLASKPFEEPMFNQPQIGTENHRQTPHIKVHIQ